MNLADGPKTLPFPVLPENEQWKFFLQKFSFAIFVASLCVPFKTSADPIRKSAPLYENPFDLSAGGASLTRATQEGVFFSNPSLPALGKGFLRWIYGRTAIHFGADAIDLGREIYKKKTAGSLKVDSSMIESLLKTPIHVGNDTTLGFISAYGGLAIFETVRSDIEGRQFGSQGLPEVRTRAEAAAGLAAMASMPVGDTLALGVSLKPAYAAETFENITLSDFSGSGAKQMLSDNFDLRFATTVDDLGQTKFSDPAVSPWKQTINAGIGIIPHTSRSAIHCAYDLRDIRRAYGEHWTRRSRVGCKLLLSSRLGFGAGYYQGWPSYGIVLNLTLLRLEAGSYTREFGSEAGTRGRRVYFLATGAEMP
ncbi:hypothetical protein EBU99_00135 [bacterium]|nr:hypothetical protein [bacterium]